jgi:hypothetical protein
MASRNVCFWQGLTGGLALLGTVLLALPGSAAATDLESFERQIGRSATDDPSRPKATCVCQDGSNLSDQAGVVERVTGDIIGGGRAVVISCAVPRFDSNTGALLKRTNCFTFQTLPR